MQRARDRPSRVGGVTGVDVDHLEACLRQHELESREAASDLDRRATGTQRGRKVGPGVLKATHCRCSPERRRPRGGAGIATAPTRCDEANWNGGRKGRPTSSSTLDDSAELAAPDHGCERRRRRRLAWHHRSRGGRAGRTLAGCRPGSRVGSSPESSQSRTCRSTIFRPMASRPGTAPCRGTGRDLADRARPCPAGRNRQAQSLPTPSSWPRRHGRSPPAHERGRGPRRGGVPGWKSFARRCCCRIQPRPSPPEPGSTSSAPSSSTDGHWW